LTVPVPLVDYSQLLVLFVVLLLSVAIHEAAHAWSADLLGDPTAAGAGRLSFSPAIHVDPVGSIIFPLVSFVSGFALIGWGKPVPVDPRHLGSAWRWKLAVIAVAGPVCSLVLATLAALSIRGGVAATHSPFDAIIAPMLFRFVDLNVLLGIFHLLPVPPLDGSLLLAAVLPAGAGSAWRARQTMGMIVLFVLLLSGALGFMLNPIRASLVSLLV
jgi:Zn-dependent protease